MKISFLIGLIVPFFLTFICEAKKLEDRTTQATMNKSDLEKVVESEFPFGNVTVSNDGRVFATFHPDGTPIYNVVEIVNGKTVPFPNKEMQPAKEGKDCFRKDDSFCTVLSVRVDFRNWLWTLDHGGYRLKKKPRLLAFDLNNNASLVHKYEFAKDEAGIGSMLNDFQVSPDGNTIFIADTSPIKRAPKIIVYDVLNKKTLIRLKKHESVVSGKYSIFVHNKKIKNFGVLPTYFGIDSIGLDVEGKWLYFSALDSGKLYRALADVLKDSSLSESEIEKRVEFFGDKTLSDGITLDQKGNIYLTDMEHSAIVVMNQQKKLNTLFKLPGLLRWPDGFGFGPGGNLYVTASALEDVLFVKPFKKGRKNTLKKGPYYLFKFRPLAPGRVGH